MVTRSEDFMPLPINPHLTHPDRIVLESLFEDVREGPESSKEFTNHDKKTATRLRELNDPTHPNFEPSVLSLYDEKDLPEWFNRFILRPYTRVATTIVRHPTDVVFLTHILWDLVINVSSAIYLFRNFTYLHGILHAGHAIWCAGPFTLMMHNHIHQRGVLVKTWPWNWFDFIFPYILEPLLGHTWDTYYYHHVKHHHVEANGTYQLRRCNVLINIMTGPDDLSSTIRYQRDELLHFLHYWARFFFLIWIDLPLYFLRKKQPVLALRCSLSELSTYIFYYAMLRLNVKAATFIFMLPLFFLRFALMIGNWGQHALVDEIEPDSDMRSSITLIDFSSNRLCFNDGWHTSHHLHPLRHWREQPAHFMEQKEKYANGKALIFHDMDFLMMTIKLLSKDYAYLARRLVPIGDQINMTQEEIEAMLRTKAKRFTEEDIKAKYRKKELGPQQKIIKYEL